MKSRTFRLDADLDPFAVGARSGLLWQRGSADDPVPVLAGVGQAATIPVERPGGGIEAQAALSALAGPNE